MPIVRFDDGGENPQHKHGDAIVVGDMFDLEGDE